MPERYLTQNCRIYIYKIFVMPLLQTHQNFTIVISIIVWIVDTTSYHGKGNGNILTPACFQY